jgi:acyl-CoA synthetase (AMP-forming)/AMP-acid ligase II
VGRIGSGGIHCEFNANAKRETVLELSYATLWEAISDKIGDEDAIVTGANRRTWTEYEDRASRLARAFGEAGLGPGSKIGMYLWNCNEYLETQFAGMKIRGVPININYRYLDDELLYLLENSDAEALVFHTSLSDRVARVKDRAKGVRLWIEVDDGGDSLPGALAYEKVVEGHDPAARITRDPTDLYMLYTGGTTGMPKGVMYETGGMVQGFIGLLYPLLGMPIPEPRQVPELAARMKKEGSGVVSIPTCPLMHGTGMWLGAMIPHCAGARVVMLEGRSFDAKELLRVIGVERPTQLVIVGDAFAKPILAALEESRDGGPAVDLSSVKFMISSGVMWTREVKEALLEWHDFLLLDAMGSSEGSMGSQITTRGNVGETAKFAMGAATKVFTEDGREVQPGSGETGMVAAGGSVPIGYYKDEAKSRATFREIDGVRYSFPGDWATIEADGTLTLLGRGSNCINTAGEKVYPEEVEEAVKAHEDVFDCLVVGVDDEKFGQRVTGVVSLQGGKSVSPDVLRAFTKTKLAGYKIPKQLFVVDRVERAPNGKADYKWARETIETLLSAD